MTSRAVRALAVAILLFGLLPLRASAAPALQMGGEIHVNSIQLDDDSSPSVAVFPDGGFVVVWTVGPRGGHKVIHARLFDRAGNPSGGEFLLGDRTAGSQLADRVVADRDGTFLLVWTQERRPGGATDVFVRRFNRNGTPRGARFRANPASASSRYGGVLAIAADGRLVVAWTKDIDLPDFAGYSDAAARIFTASGAPLTTDFTVGFGYPGVGDDNIYAYPTGLSVGPGESLSFLTQNVTYGALDTWLYTLRRGGPESYTQLSDYWASGFSTCSPGAWLTMEPQGGLIAVWSEFDAEVQRFAGNGTAIGAKAPVSRQEASSPQPNPVVALLPGGGFVVIWTDTAARDGSDWGLYGRTFAGDGTPVSRDLRINVTTEGDQYAPQIAAGAKGPVVVVWNQSTGDVFARILVPASP